MFDGPHLGGEVGGADDVDAREGQQQDVGRCCERGGDVAFQGLDFPGFLQAVVVECQGEAAVGGGAEVGGRGLGGPGEHGVEGGALEADAGGVEAVAQASAAGGEDVGGGGEVSGDVPATIAVPEVAEAGGEAGQCGVEVLADLGAEGGGLLDEVAPVPDEESESGPLLVEGLLDEGEAVDGGAVDGGEVGGVGLVAGVAGLTERFRSKRVDDAGLEAGGGEGAAGCGGSGRCARWRRGGL